MEFPLLGPGMLAIVSALLVAADGCEFAAVEVALVSVCVEARLDVRP